MRAAILVNAMLLAAALSPGCTIFVDQQGSEPGTAASPESTDVLSPSAQAVPATAMVSTVYSATASPSSLPVHTTTPASTSSPTISSHLPTPRARETVATPSPHPDPLATLLVGPEISTATPTASAPQTQTIRLGEKMDMKPGQTAVLEGTAVQITLLEAHGPPEGCHDCPVKARVQVTLNGQTQIVAYSFSGNMVFELLQEARRKVAFDYRFIAARIDENSFTLLVEPVDP